MTFQAFAATDVIQANPTLVTQGIWPGATGTLNQFYINVAQATASNSGKYYWNVYNQNVSSSTALICFAVAYGHQFGGGSPSLVLNNASTLETQGTYFQYRNILLEPGQTQFTFENSYPSSQFYVIVFERAQLLEELNAGNWQLTLSGSSGSFTFIDDSGQTLGTQFGHSGNVFNVVSGSLSGSIGYTIAATQSVGNNGGFGLVYPGLGIILLNPAAIQYTVGFPTGSNYYFAGTGSSGSAFGGQNGGAIASGSGLFAPFTGTSTLAAYQYSATTQLSQYNHVGLLNSILLGGNFEARNAQNISSTHYFVRLMNASFNYSNNPTFFDETTGNILNTAFVNDPRVYVTTIGLYNAANELMAVAKLSQPTQKAFDKELLCRVRLDW